MNPQETAESLITVADKLMPEESRLKAWLANGESIKPMRFGRRVLIMAPRGSQIVISGIPFNKPSDQWVDWYRKHPDFLPQTWNISEAGEVTRGGNMINALVAKEAGEQLSASWQALGTEFSHQEIEEAPIVVLEGGEAALEETKAEIIVEAEEPAPSIAIPEEIANKIVNNERSGAAAQEANQAGSKARLVREERPEYTWQFYPIAGKSVIACKDGTISAIGDEGAIIMVVKRPEANREGQAAEPEANMWVVEGNVWREDPVLFMSASLKPEKLEGIDEASRAIVTLIRNHKIQGFKRGAVLSAVLRSEVARTGKLPEAMVGQGDVCYASLFTWEGEGEIEVKAVAAGVNPTQVVAIKHGDINAIYAPVEAAYSLRLSVAGAQTEMKTSEDDIILAMSLYGDGSVKMLDDKQAKKVTTAGSPVKIIKVDIKPQRGSQSEEAVGHEPASSQGSDEPRSLAHEEEGPPDWPDEREEANHFENEEQGDYGSPDDSFSSDEPQFSESPILPSKTKAKRAKSSETTESVGPGRSPFQGAISVSSWSRIVPRGWLWAAQLVLAAMDSSEELEEIGGETEIQLLHKGFPFSKSDKQTIDGLLRGTLKSKIESVRIYSVGANDYFVRADGSNFRIIGPGGKIISGGLAAKLQKAYTEDPAVVSRHLVGPETAEARGRGR